MSKTRESQILSKLKFGYSLATRELSPKWEPAPGFRPCLDVLIKPSGYYENCSPFPYEIMMKIFKYVIELSDEPLNEICRIAGTCYAWQLMIKNSPRLWSRIDLSQLPLTDGNMKNLRSILNSEPKKLDSINELSLSGTIDCKKAENIQFIADLIKSPKLKILSLRDLTYQRKSWLGIISKSLVECKELHHLSITESRALLHNHKWLSDHIIQNGRHLEVLNLAMSLTSISSQLFRSLSSDYCPNLKVLDVSTCEALNTHSFDVIQLIRSMPNLEILRVGNVSFKRVYERPETKGLTKLKELSMPIGMRDADRDDPLFATLTYGSTQITTLDLRGSSISPHALVNMPSCDVKELHMDDLCPINRPDYEKVITKWSHSIETLSLVKINCSETLRSCLNALSQIGPSSKLKDLDLSSSDVESYDLKNLLDSVGYLEKLDLTSCRSLPRGCKRIFSRNTKQQISLAGLSKKLSADLGEVRTKRSRNR